MSNYNRQLKFCFVAVVVYVFLFYNWEAGLNVFLFDALLISLHLRAVGRQVPDSIRDTRPKLGKQTGYLVAVAALLASALSIVIVHSPTALLAHTVSFLILLGYAQLRELRFVWFAALLGLRGLFCGPRDWWRARREAELDTTRSARPAAAWLRQALLPLLIVLPFLGLYLSGSSDLLRSLSWIGEISFPGVSFINVIFLTVLGSLLVIPLVFHNAPQRITELDAGMADELSRERLRAGKKSVFRLPMSGLRGEYRRAVLTLATLNLLLLLVNATDLRFVWLSARGHTAAELSQFVHAGTLNLTLSILLAMAVVLYFFRGNLNFYREAPLLRPLTYAWIGQNALLALSVGVRNWHYIDAYGLAMGRVRVAFALALILFGLFSLYRKADRRLSMSYLFQSNGLAAWWALVLFGALNWSCLITRVNLTQETGRVDWQYLTQQLGEDNYFLLLRAEDRIPERYRKRLRPSSGPEDWRGWNWPEHRNANALRQNHHLTGHPAVPAPHEVQPGDAVSRGDTSQLPRGGH